MHNDLSEDFSIHDTSHRAPEDFFEAADTDVRWGPFTYTGFQNAVDVSWWNRIVEQFLLEFDPAELLIRHHATRVASGPRPTDNVGPMFAECMRAMIFLLQQHVQTSTVLEHHRNYPKLLLLTQCLPILLLRWNPTITGQQNARQQRRWCQQFLQGGWLNLYRNTTAALQSQNQRQKSKVVLNPESQPETERRRWLEAKDFVEAGCVGKARARLLRREGPSPSPVEILSNLGQLHPEEAEPEHFHIPVGQNLDWINGSWLARQIRSSPKRVAHDQFGWTMHETWKPLLGHDDILSSFASAVFIPMAMGYQPVQFAPITVGGRLIGIPKGHKPGVRPICIGSAWRRLLAKGLLARQKVALESYFLNHHPRVLQFCCGHTNGSTKLVQLLRSALDSSSRLGTGHVVIALDIKNAFNTISRSHLFTALHLHQRQFQELFPYILSHYGRHGELRVYLRGEAHIISSETGVHQGDPFGSILFALGLHPFLLELADLFPQVLVLAYADNVFLAGPLQDALCAAAEFKTRVASAGLVLNDRESGIICDPRLLDDLQPPFSLSDLTVLSPDITLPFLADGILALGCPLGSPEFQQSVKAKLFDDIQSELDTLLSFPYHHHRSKIVTFATNARFTYHSRCWPVSLLSQAAAEMDAQLDSFLCTSLPFFHRPSSLSLSTRHDSAMQQIRLNLSYGGWGLRSHSDHLAAAVYSSIAELFRWLHSRESGSLSGWLGFDLAATDLESLINLNGTLIQDLQWAIHQLQSRWSFSLCERPPPPSSVDLSVELPRRQASRVSSASIPSLRGILHWPSDARFPRQHNISHFISARLWTCLRQSSQLDPRDCARLDAVCRYEVPLRLPHSALSCPASSKSVSVTPRSLMALTCLFYLDNADFLDLEALFLGLPVPSLLSSLPASSLSSHGALGDFQFSSSTHAGHTRKQTHDQLAALIGDMARRAGFSGVQTTYSRIPTCDSSRRGDIYFPGGLCPADSRRAVVCDFRLGHLFTRAGQRRNGGRGFFTAISREKNRKYQSAYHGRNITFVPLPASTFLGVGPEVCHLLFRLAAQRAGAAGSSLHPDPSSSPSCSSSTPVDHLAHDVCFSRLLKELQHGLALATLSRLRGSDGFIPASP